MSFVVDAPEFAGVPGGVLIVETTDGRRFWYQEYRVRMATVRYDHPELASHMMAKALTESEQKKGVSWPQRT